MSQAMTHKTAKMPEIEIKDLEAEREEIVRSLPQTD